jgi:hypothetical protein
LRPAELSVFPLGGRRYKPPSLPTGHSDDDLEVIPEVEGIATDQSAEWGAWQVTGAAAVALGASDD